MRKGFSMVQAMRIWHPVSVSGRKMLFREYEFMPRRACRSRSPS